MQVAAFDIGSNTLLMLVARSRDGELEPVVDRCRFSRLGKGIDDSGALAADSIALSLEIIEAYAAEASELGVDRVGAVGTQALREASNAADFVDPASEILGAPIEIIEGTREAELVFRATAEAFPELAEDTLVIADVGGGSTEITIGRGGELASAVSVPIGAVRMTERHLHSDPPGPAEVRTLMTDIDEALAEVELPTKASLIGTAGTATSFASVELKLPAYDPGRVQGFVLSPAQVDRLLARFLELTVAEKRKLTGLEEARADVIAGGAAIYARLLARMQAPSFIVSDRGVRWGLAAELADR